MTSYFEIKDAERTAWYSFQHPNGISDGIELLYRATCIDPNPSVKMVEQCGGAALQPISREEYRGILEQVAGREWNGLTAKVDLEKDACCFTDWWVIHFDNIKITGAVSELAQAHKMSIDPTTGKLNERRVVSNILAHCSWVYLSPDDMQRELRQQLQELESSMGELRDEAPEQSPAGSGFQQTM